MVRPELEEVLPRSKVLIEIDELDPSSLLVLEFLSERCGSDKRVVAADVLAAALQDLKRKVFAQVQFDPTKPFNQMIAPNLEGYKE